jgi:hypothetical protein
MSDERDPKHNEVLSTWTASPAPANSTTVMVPVVPRGKCNTWRPKLERQLALLQIVAQREEENPRHSPPTKGPTSPKT